MSHKAIRALIETRLADWAIGMDYPVAWENATFTPPAGATWLRFTMLPAETRSADLEGKHREYRGIAQIDLFVPTGAGPGFAGDLIAEIEDLFPVSTYLTSVEASVIVLTPVSAAVAQSDQAFHVIPCSFTYRADVLIS